MKKTIIIVDDCASLRSLVSATLKDVGHEVLEAPDRREALFRLKSRRVNLIVSSARIPDMDCITFIEEVKALPQCSTTPVLMLTCEAHAEDDARRLAREANAWMAKPFKPEQLLAAVANLTA